MPPLSVDVLLLGVNVLPLSLRAGSDSPLVLRLYMLEKESFLLSAARCSFVSADAGFVIGTVMKLRVRVGRAGRWGGFVIFRGVAGGWYL